MTKDLTVCPHCGNDDPKLTEILCRLLGRYRLRCEVCSKSWEILNETPKPETHS